MDVRPPTITEDILHRARQLALRKPTRTLLACLRCRVTKTGCSDSRPCARCTTLGARCIPQLPQQKKKNDHQHLAPKKTTIAPVAIESLLNAEADL